MQKIFKLQLLKQLNTDTDTDTDCTVSSKKVP